VHFWARDDGVGRIAKVGEAVWKAVAAIEGCIDRTGVNETKETADGRIRRRRNVRGILGGVVGLRCWSKTKVRDST